MRQIECGEQRGMGWEERTLTRGCDKVGLVLPSAPYFYTRPHTSTKSPIKGKVNPSSNLHDILMNFALVLFFGITLVFVDGLKNAWVSQAMVYVCVCVRALESVTLAIQQCGGGCVAL